MAGAAAARLERVATWMDNGRSPSAHPALVLNADYSPLSYFPLSLWSWEGALKAVFLDRVNIVAEYDRVVRSPSVEMRLPSVVCLRRYVRSGRHPAFTRFNLFLRDEFRCQYCGADGEVTFDHVKPRSAGGRTEWRNVVAACPDCNRRKGNKTLHEAGMRLLRAPVRPTTHRLKEIGRKFPPNYLHESWADYVYWDAALKP